MVVSRPRTQSNEADQCGCTVYAPMNAEEKKREAGKDPYARKKGRAMRLPHGGAE